jgi:hypothetical protein
VSLKKAPRDFPEDSELESTIQDILYPYLKTEDPIIAIQFGVPKNQEEEWRQAVGFVSAFNTYKKEKVGRLTKHSVEFKPEQAWEIHQLYEMVEKSPHLEIYIDGMRLPHAATLWLPLLWFYL